MPPRLQARGIRASAGGKHLFGPTDLEIAPGRWLAVRGPSGAGKTTLLRILAGLKEPDEGQISLGGQSPEAVGWPNYRRRVVYVAQQPTFLPGSTEDNLRRPFAYASVQAEFDRRRAESLLRAFGLSENTLAQSSDQLSVGEGQRVALTRALLLNPEVLLLDEPTSALDTESVGRVEAALGVQSSEHQTSIILVSHQRAHFQEHIEAVVELGSGDEP